MVWPIRMVWPIGYPECEHRMEGERMIRLLRSAVLFLPVVVAKKRELELKKGERSYTRKASSSSFMDPC
jgi:hypothetical protein